MDQRTKDLFTKLEKKLSALEQELTKLPAEQLSKRPKLGAWSVLEVLHHLKIAEAGSQRYIEKKLSYNSELPNTNLQSEARSLFLTVFNRFPLKFKAPKAVNEANFPKDIPFSQIMEDWKVQRQNLHDYLNSLDASLFKKQVYKHPLGGRLSLTNMLQFFDSHFDRHYQQIQRTLRAV